MSGSQYTSACRDPGARVAACGSGGCTMACGCSCGAHSDSALVFYVTARNDAGRSRFILGPYDAHEAALADVHRASALVGQVDVRAPWYAYGTASAPAGTISSDSVVFRRDGSFNALAVLAKAAPQ